MWLRKWPPTSSAGKSSPGSGRQEVGPRALGHRSIITDPSRFDARNRLNVRVKYRESFRPFAPSVLPGGMAKFFELPAEMLSTRYMLFALPLREHRMTQVIPAVIQENGATGKPVSEEDYVAQIKAALARIPAGIQAPVEVDHYNSGSYFNPEEVPLLAQSAMLALAVVVVVGDRGPRAGRAAWARAGRAERRRNEPQPDAAQLRALHRSLPAGAGCVQPDPGRHRAERHLLRVPQALAHRGSEGLTPMGLLRGPAAVNQDVRAGDEAGVLGAEIDREVANLFDLAPPAQRDLGDELLVQLGVLDQRCIHLGGDRTGADAVDGDLLGR